MRGPSAGLSGVHCLRSSEEKPRVRRGIGTVPTTDARLETGHTLASLSRATNKTTSMRAPGLSLLAAVVAISASSDALSTLNGRVDEEHNAIVVEGGYPMHVQSELLSGLQIHARGLEVSLCGRTCVSHKQTQNPK